VIFLNDSMGERLTMRVTAPASTPPPADLPRCPTVGYHSRPGPQHRHLDRDRTRSRRGNVGTGCGLTDWIGKTVQNVGKRGAVRVQNRRPWVGWQREENAAETLTGSAAALTTIVTSSASSSTEHRAKTSNGRMLRAKLRPGLLVHRTTVVTVLRDRHGRVPRERSQAIRSTSSEGKV
jgi:hypothetical protein